MFDLEEGFDPLNRECYCDLKRHALAWKHDTMPAKAQRDPKNKVKRIKCHALLLPGCTGCASKYNPSEKSISPQL